MKIVGIGDLFIPSDCIRRGFAAWTAAGADLCTVDWQLDGFDDLQAINHQIERGGSDVYEPPQEIRDACKDADIIITQFCPITRSLIDSCPQLKLIGVLRSGCENINLDYATQKGIAVFNTQGRNADSVADFTVGLMLSEARNIARGHAGLKQGEWIREYPNASYIPELPGKVVGLVGLGAIGRKVARRLSGFDVRLIAFDPYVRTPPEGVALVSLETLMADADFISLHARLTPDTEKMISRELIDSMKPTAYLINTARSALIDEEALADALRERRIAGAGLDVFNVEPPGITHPLVVLDNVTLTPHMAGGSTDAFLNSPGRLAAELIKLRQGGMAGGRVNAALAPSSWAWLANSTKGGS
ncbi:MAG: 2-hydroxyacid dehydrogenase [Bacillota bacterium]|nr:2-hydroxyacid dehydrogenase [Bacillota bacterium]